MTDPLRLTPLERYADDVLRFENRERYIAQSASTKVALLGTLPARAQTYDHGGPQPVIMNYADRRGI
ncbi:hypothetical protein [Pseudoxanthomonas sacheonensis]|uniref:hypothetical protein n=1 Tax=Pseudoxanthomonas sacheonensis TaxID=443615 RepID=UPI0013D62C9A|nr:hypothetical protein [Pseudoxanthomonas sacheonensis]